MLTAKQVEKAKAGSKDITLFDGQHGLYLLVKPSGSKLWRMKYQKDGKGKLMSLGQWPEVSLQKARDRAVDERRKLEDGIDVIAERKAKRAGQSDAPTFEDVAWNWYDNWKAERKSRYVTQQKQRLEANIFPTLGKRPVQEIEPSEVIACVKAVEERGAADLAYRTKAVISEIFEYAMVHGLAKSNPAAIRTKHILKPRAKGHHAHVEVKEVPALLQTVEGYAGAQTRLAFRLIAYTFLRTSELVGARWDEFDGLESDEPMWRIPAQRMKRKREHIVPLAPQAVEILAELRRENPRSEYVFPGQGKAKHMSSGTLLHALTRMGYRGPGTETLMTGHGFRSIASTALHENGWEHELIELQLAHAEESKVSASYNFATRIPDRRRMMVWYAGWIDEQAAKGKLAD